MLSEIYRDYIVLWRVVAERLSILDLSSGVSDQQSVGSSPSLHMVYRGRVHRTQALVFLIIRVWVQVPVLTWCSGRVVKCTGLELWCSLV